MKKYVYYVVLFIFLMGIGIVFVNLYSKKTFKNNNDNIYISDNKTIDNEKEDKEEENEIKEKSENNTDTTSSISNDNITNSNVVNGTNNSINDNTSSKVVESNNLADTSVNNSANTTQNTDTNDNNIEIVLDDNDTNVSLNSVVSENTDIVLSINEDTTSNNKVAEVKEDNTSSSSNLTDEFVIVVNEEEVKQEQQSQEESTKNESESKEEKEEKEEESTEKTEKEVQQSSSVKQSDNGDTSSYKMTVSFKNIDNCSNTKVIATTSSSSNKKVNVHFCVRGATLNNTSGKTMQNFAITDKYIYFSYTNRGSWATDSYISSNGRVKALKKVSATYIQRINKNDNTYQIGYLEFAGHAQSFDVLSSSEDQIYTNYFAKLYKGSLGNGAKYVGVTILPFTKNNKENGVELIPTTSYYINSSANNVKTLSSSSYLKDGKLTDKYYEKVREIGSNTSLMNNPEVAVDESGNKIAFVSGTTAYVFKLSSFKQKKLSLINKFQVASDKQGVELSDNYLYLWKGTRKSNYTLKKYNIKTGKCIDTLTLDLKKYYSTNESNNGHEAEGISIYNNNIYLGIQGNNRNNDILMITNFN